MFNFGFFELILLFVIVIVFVGPEQLPAVAKKLLTLLNQWKQITTQVKKPLNTMQEEITKSFNKSREILLKEEEDIKEKMNLKKEANPEETANLKDIKDIKEKEDTKDTEDIKNINSLDQK